MTDISLFKDIKPSWDIVGFDEKISSEPQYIRRYSRGDRRSIMAIYGSVMGDSLVYRVFDTKLEVDSTHHMNCTFRLLPTNEVERYVFCATGLYLENSDRTRVMITPDRIYNPDELNVEEYDSLEVAGIYEQRALFREFLHKVDIANKKEIVQAMHLVKKDYPHMGFRPFVEMYSKAIKSERLEDAIPDRIIRELNSRSHMCDTEVRIDKDLVVITGQRRCRYLDCVEQVRFYFDRNYAYFFRENAVTHRWQIYNSWEMDLITERNRMDVYNRLVDRDLFDNTCMENYETYSVAQDIPTGSKISLKDLLTQYRFLSAEQAAKMHSPVYDVIRSNIICGVEIDRTKPLPELLGISGPQIKFLDNIEIPDDLERFAECVNSEQFKKYFPDTKKRIFAVSFYLYKTYTEFSDLIYEELFEAAQTLNSLENISREKRKYLMEVYKDYIFMLRQYHVYEDYRLDGNNPLHEEIEKYGEFTLNIKPSRILDCHNKLASLLDAISCSDKITTYSAAISERKKKEGKDVEYTNGKYSIIMPKDASDIICEGRMLKHCVGSAGYIERMSEGITRILFLRNNKDIHTPLLTLEDRQGIITQCYGFGDSYNKNSEIRDFIKEYAGHRGLRIDAVIYSDE